MGIWSAGHTDPTSCPDTNTALSSHLKALPQLDLQAEGRRTGHARKWLQVEPSKTLQGWMVLMMIINLADGGGYFFSL
jgi:hypothetical protein